MDKGKDIPDFLASNPGELTQWTDTPVLYSPRVTNGTDQTSLTNPPTSRCQDQLHLDPQARQQTIAAAMRTILKCLGEDPEREGLVQTPERYARAMLFFTQGYNRPVQEVVNNAVFTVDSSELVLVKDIDIFSLCEHHLVPFHGKVCAPHPISGQVMVLKHQLGPYRLRPEPARPGPVQTGSGSRSVRPTTADPGTSHAGNRARHRADPQSGWGRRRHRVHSHVHGYARRAKDRRRHEHLLYDRDIKQRPGDEEALLEYDGTIKVTEFVNSVFSLDLISSIQHSMLLERRHVRHAQPQNNKAPRYSLVSTETIWNGPDLVCVD